MTLPNLLAVTLAAAIPLTNFFVIGNTQEEKRSHDDDSPLTEAQQEELLETRVTPWITNNFDATCSMMFAFEDVAIHTYSDNLGHISVYSPFPGKYEPTWRECFDTVARQVTCNWAYEPESTYWVFTPEGEEASKLPFELILPRGWTSERKGNYQLLRSENKHALVEIHMLGSYSTDRESPEERKEFYVDIREQQATRLVGKDAEDFDLQTVSLADIAGHEARHHEKLPNEDGYHWRQWIFMSHGYCFVVNSTITPQFDEALSKEVQVLLGGFAVTTPAPGWREPEPEETTSK